MEIIPSEVSDTCEVLSYHFETSPSTDPSMTSSNIYMKCIVHTRWPCETEGFLRTDLNILEGMVPSSQEFIPSQLSPNGGLYF